MHDLIAEAAEEGHPDPMLPLVRLRVSIFTIPRVFLRHWRNIYHDSYSCVFTGMTFGACFDGSAVSLTSLVSYVSFTGRLHRLHNNQSTAVWTEICWKG